MTVGHTHTRTLTKQYLVIHSWAIQISTQRVKMPRWNFQGSIIHEFQLAQATAAPPAAMVMLTNGTNYEQIYHDDDDDDEKQQINLKYSNYV